MFGSWKLKQKQMRVKMIKKNHIKKANKHTFGNQKQMWGRIKTKSSKQKKKVRMEKIELNWQRFVMGKRTTK